MGKQVQTIAFIGFGEAAQAFASGLKVQRDIILSAYDAHSNAAIVRASGDCNVRLATTAADAVFGADAVFSLVTADQALAAAEAFAASNHSNPLWLDCNSCSPGTKQKAAAVMEARGARYVDAAVMAPVNPKLHRTPILLSGPHAKEARAFMSAIGMDVNVVGGDIGSASSIKMMRSVMVKGMEALVAECILAARKAGVEDKVLASLQTSDPDTQWAKKAAYGLERMMVHGKRRAAEMREVSATLRELGLPDRMSAATAQWQEDISMLKLAAGADDLGQRADIILKALAR